MFGIRDLLGSSDSPKIGVYTPEFLYRAPALSVTPERLTPMPQAHIDPSVVGTQAELAVMATFTRICAERGAWHGIELADLLLRLHNEADRAAAGQPAIVLATPRTLHSGAQDDMARDAMYRGGRIGCQERGLLVAEYVVDREIISATEGLVKAFGSAVFPPGTQLIAA